MRRIAKKILLPLLCVVALCASAVGMLGITGSANGSTTSTILAEYDIDSYNGAIQTGKAGDGIVTAWDILEKDGYIEGVWIPWLTHSWLGSSLAPNDLENYDSYIGSDGSTKDYWQAMNQVGIDQYDNTQLEMEIFNLKALGYNAMAYAGSPWAEGRENDLNTWECTGVKAEYLTNIRRFLDICRRAGMPVVWYLHFHSSAVPGYANLDMWYKIAQVQGNKEYADSYAENFVKPVCEVLSEYRDVVVMCGIADETFNEINDSDLGDKFAEKNRDQYGVTEEDSMYFHAQIGKMVKQVMPDMPTTCADNADQYAMYGDAILDMPGRNQYSDGTSASTNVTNAWATGPLMAGEYGMGGSSGAYTEDDWSSTMIAKRENYLSTGYSGFFQWAYEPVFKTAGAAAPNGNQMIRTGGTSPYDLRTGCYKAYYWAMERQGKSADAPSAMYYCGKTISMTSGGSHVGNGKVYYIRPENNATVTVQRSTDGGATWTTINGTTTYDTNAGNHRACLTDPSPVTSGSVQYRVSANGYMSYTNVWTY
ncbi:MAG: hypothetical protein IJO42_04245 [Clostridia bacterium]|nr:hypothetical protein [Clostridia bacterium]